MMNFTSNFTSRLPLNSVPARLALPTTRCALLSCALLSCALLTVGCGSDDPAETSIDAAPIVDAAPQADASPDAAVDQGSATITGTLAEQTVEPLSVFLIDHPIGGFKVLVMTEDASLHCEVGSGTGLVAVVGFPCGDAVVGTTAIAGSETIDCKSADGHWFLVEGFTGEFSEYEAVSGSLTIDSVGASVEGSFSADFGDKGALAGSFEAVTCP